MLLFEENHEPDLAVLKEAPEASEVFSPDAFERAEIPERPGGAKAHMSYRIIVRRTPGVHLQLAYRITSDDGQYDRTLSVPDVGAEEIAVDTLIFDDVPLGVKIDIERVSSSGTTIEASGVLTRRTKGTPGEASTNVVEIPMVSLSEGAVNYDLEGSLPA